MHMRFLCSKQRLSLAESRYWVTSSWLWSFQLCGYGWIPFYGNRIVISRLGLVMDFSSITRGESERRESEREKGGRRMESRNQKGKKKERKEGRKKERETEHVINSVICRSNLAALLQLLLSLDSCSPTAKKKKPNKSHRKCHHRLCVGDWRFRIELHLRMSLQICLFRWFPLCWRRGNKIFN